MSILNIDLNNISLDTNFDENDPDTIMLSKFWVGTLNSKNERNLKKS